MQCLSCVKKTDKLWKNKSNVRNVKVIKLKALNQGY
jgi:hypothetical protein